jgi:hypothetical protein
MKRLLIFGTPVVLVVLAATTTVALAHQRPGPCQGAPVPFKDATLIVETNATDGDAGLQVFLDHEPWRSVAIQRPDGRKILDVTTRGVLTDYGLTELFSESSEPPFDEFPFEEFQRLFPAGEYRFTGCTIDGQRMRSAVTLTHDIPAGPEIVAPEDESTVPADEVVVRWEPVTEPAGVEIVRYQVLVVGEEEDPPQVFSADLPATATELSVPGEFLAPGAEYKVEVVAVEVSGNQTLTELTFTAG